MSTPAPLPTIDLYRFLPARYAIMAIESRELRVGRLSELNDPFEVRPASSQPLNPANLNIEQNTNFLKAADVSYGILCFSHAPQDPVVWSHYSEGHQGIALCFEYERDDSLLEVVYPKSRERPVLDEDFFIEHKALGPAEDALIKLMRTKALSWAYEKEFRVLPELQKCATRNGMYFQKFDKAKLKAVVLGTRCTVSENYIEHALDGSGLNAAIQQADIHPKLFKVGFREVRPQRHPDP